MDFTNQATYTIYFAGMDVFGLQLKPFWFLSSQLEPLEVAEDLLLHLMYEELAQWSKRVQSYKRD